MTAERAFRILWGPTLENVLDFSYPVVGSSPLHWRAPRPESQLVTSGATSVALITGRYYRLKVTAQYFALAQNFGALGLQAFLDWAMDSNPFTLVPNSALPALTVTGCYLEGPFDSLSPSLESDVTQTLDLTILHPTVDMGLAWRGLFFEYAAGGSLTDPVAYTFARASVGYEVNNQGYLTQNPSGTLCDGHYPDPLGTGVQTTLLEAAVANDVTNPEDLSNGSWTKTNTTITANNAKAPDKAQTADLLKENTDTAQQHAVNSAAYTVADSDTCTALVFLRDAGRFRGLFRITNAAGTVAAGVTYNLHTQALVGTDTQGGSAVTGSKIIALAGGWYMLWMRVTLGTGATSVFGQVWMFDATGTISYNGDGASGTYVWGMTAVHGLTNTVAAYTPTTAVADSLKGAYAIVPQTQWFYLKFVESGQALVVDSNRGGILAVGSTTAATPALDMLTDGGVAGKYIFRHLNAAAAGVQATAATSPAQGDTVELLGLRFADGSVQIIQSINGGAEVASAVTGALAIDYTVWTNLFIGLGMRRGGVAGTAAINVFKTGPLVTSGAGAVMTIAAARAV